MPKEFVTIYEEDANGKKEVLGCIQEIIMNQNECIVKLPNKATITDEDLVDIIDKCEKAFAKYGFEVKYG